MRRFFVGKAVGTIIVFGVLAVYLLLRYVLHLFYLADGDEGLLRQEDGRE